MTFKLALSQAPKHVEGEYAEIYDPYVLALAKPPSMSRGVVT
jgi:hypothetical protein